MPADEKPVKPDGCASEADAAADVDIHRAAEDTAAHLTARARVLTADLPLDVVVNDFGPTLEALAPDAWSR